MIARLLACTACLMGLNLLPSPARATEEPVAIEHEPRHRLVFANDHVRFFDVQLEPGYESRYHWHRNDGVFVNIASAPTIAQDLGKDPVRRGERAIGETYFIDYGARPKAHRVTNPGSSVYHVTDTEILRGCSTAGSLAEGPNQNLVLDNARVLVTRIILHPGEYTELAAPCGMLVAVSAGDIALQSAAESEQITLQPAGFRWRQKSESIRLLNTGKFVFHAIDIRLK